MVVSCFVRCRLVVEKSHQKKLVRFSERGSKCKLFPNTQTAPTYIQYTTDQLSQFMYLNVNGTMKWLFFLLLINICIQKHDLRLLYVVRPTRSTILISHTPKLLRSSSSQAQAHSYLKMPPTSRILHHNRQITYLEKNTSQLPLRRLIHKPRPIQLFGFGREICCISQSQTRSKPTICPFSMANTIAHSPSHHPTLVAR